MTVDWQTGDTVTSTCTRCQAQHGDTPHAVLEVLELLEGSVFRVQCLTCSSTHRDKILAGQPGPQSDFLGMVWVFLLLYGGAAYGGKSYALLLDALSHANTPGWVGVIFRRHSKDLTGGGTIFDKAKKLFAGTGAVPREGQYVDFTWPSGAVLLFKHLDGANVDDYQGQEFAWIGIDEATHLELSWILYLMTRLRTDCGATPVMRMTCNPDKRHPLRQWVAPWLLPDATADRSKSGMVRYWALAEGSSKITWGDSRAEVAELTGRPEPWVKTFAFIPSMLDDNPIGTELNPDYEASLALAGPVEERKLRLGNWDAEEETRGLLRLLLERILESPLADLRAGGARGWDLAGTEPRADYDPDFTAGARLRWDIKGNCYWDALAICRREPPGVIELMRSTSVLDGQLVTQAFWRDPAQAGKAAAMFTRKQLEQSPRCGPVVDEPAGSRLNQKVLNATPVAEALRQNKMFILAGPWLDQPYNDGGNAPRTILDLIRAQLGSFPSDKPRDKDDIADGVSLAYRVGSTARVVVGSPKQTALEGQRLAAQQRGGLRGGGRRGYGGRR